MRLKNAIYDYEYMTTDALMAELCEQIETAPEFGFDLETTALQPWDGRIRLAQFSFGRKVYIVDFFKVHPEKIIKALQQYRGVMIGQFLKFEQKWMLWHYKVKFGKLFDTYRASNILLNGKTDFSGKPLKHTLYDIYARYNITPKAQDYQAFDWASPELPVGALDYAAEDVIFMSELREKMKSDIIAANLTDTATVEMNVLLPEAAIELKGMHFNKELWLKTAEENKIKSESLQKELYTLLPNPSNQLQLFQNVATWNLDSNDQLLQSLKKLGIKQRKDITVLNERGFPQIIGEEIVPLENTMEMSLANAVYPDERTEKLVQKVIEYRGISQRLKTFGPEYLKFVNPHTGRLHTSFYGFTGAGRYSSKEPNLQQLPRDKEYRACFEAAPGKWWVAADYKNIEMVIAAEIANDTRLREIFASDDKYLGDAHYITAAAVAGCEPHEVPKDGRQKAKPVNFGFVYGMGANKMVLYAKAGYGVTLSKDEAARYRETFFELYQGVYRWHQKVKGSMNGVCRTLGGRIRYMKPDAYNEYFNCLDAETEALTTRGWVKGFDLTKDDVLLTKNPETGGLEWHKPEELKLWPDYEGPMVEFKSRSFHAVSTPNHRWLVDSKTKKNNVKVTADISVYGDDSIHRTGVYTKEESKYSDAFVSLCGWFLTDGSLYLIKNRGTWHVTLCQSVKANPSKVQKIDSLLECLKWGYSKHIWGPTGQCQWHLHNAQSALLQSIFPERRLTMEFLTSISAKQCQLLLESMLDGDGTRGSKTSFTCASLQQAELFQILCTLSGNSASITKRDFSNRVSKKYESMSNVPKSGVSYTVTIHSRKFAQVTKEQKTETIVKVGIWCPIVKNTFFVARRSGHVFITGNTPVQGTGADGLKRALRLLYDRYEKELGGQAELVHDVHDEIISETATQDKELIAETRRIKKSSMEEAMRTYVKTIRVQADPADGKNWAETH